MALLDIDAELAALPAMSGEQLRGRWMQLTGKSPPKVRPALQRMALAWEMQAIAYGGLSQTARRQLMQDPASTSITRAATPGMRLAREWNGTLHTVIIGDDGAVHWNGKVWNSLSEVARAITGTRWSGPAFFGLKTKRKAA